MAALFIALVIFISDRLTKHLALNIENTIPVVKNVFHLTLVCNTGAGFGILKGYRIFFIILSFAVLAIVAYKWKKIPEDKNITIPLGLILGGLLGNLVGRIYPGYVIDFIDFRIWPVFNVADSAITIAAFWLIIYLWNK
ncbi:signal peptidase II [Candidatus Woesearchaeota archaeon]|nr:signal peptidase II [Candidatus Woesearchaeota archaeon]